MPFIRGRYYINPIVGAALESAREAAHAGEAEDAAAQSDVNGASSSADPTAPAKGPIRRVEIETSEVVPSHSGRSQHGFVARVHRADIGFDARKNFDSLFAPGDSSGSSNSDSARAQARNSVVLAPPEQHVFSNHDDLLDFLRWELENDCGK